MTFFLSVLGVVLIIEGLPYFAFPSKVKEVAKQLPSFPDNLLRGFGLFLMVAGLIIAYLANRFP